MNLSVHEVSEVLLVCVVDLKECRGDGSRQVFAGRVVCAAVDRESSVPLWRSIEQLRTRPLSQHAPKLTPFAQSIGDGSVLQHKTTSHISHRLHREPVFMNIA